MKRILASNMILMMAMLSFAQTDTHPEMMDRAKAKRVILGYERALQSDNMGVRQSALYQLARIRSRFPNVDLENSVDKVAQMSKKDEEPVVRAQASLTLVYLQDRELIQSINPELPSDPVTFYNQVHVAVAGIKQP
jgi:hypothetical protein